MQLPQLHRGLHSAGHGGAAALGPGLQAALPVGGSRGLQGLEKVVESFLGE